MVSSLDTQPESAVLSLLKAGVDEGKSVVAFADASKWMQRNQPKNVALYYHAGRAAELSGYWKEAVALYRQCLVDGADLKSATADDAVSAVYTLLGRIGDSAAAYAFGRKEGDRLLVCPSAKKFDGWFLEQAASRSDTEAVARRLLACIEAGYPEDLLVARYGNHFRWLLLDVGRVRGKGDAPLSKSCAETCRKLAMAITFSEELRQELARVGGGDKSPGKEDRAVVNEAIKDINVSRYEPFSTEVIRAHKGMSSLKQNRPDLCKPHPLEGEFRSRLADALKRGKLESWQVIAWVNMQWPEQDEGQARLAQDIVGSSAFNELSFEAQFALREWFGKAAMTPGQATWIDAGDSRLLGRPLLALKNDADVNATVAALDATIEGIRKSPVRAQVRGFEKLADVSDVVFVTPQVQQRIVDLLDGFRIDCDRESVPLAERLLGTVRQKNDPVVTQRIAAFLWRVGMNDGFGAYDRMLQLAQSLLDRDPATASALANVGRAVCQGGGGEQVRWLDRNRPAIQSITGKASIALGLMNIPVPATHPGYPIYKAQSEWVTGNEGAAWALLDANWEQLLPAHRALTPDFMLWVLHRTISTRNDVRMQNVVTPLLSWAAADRAAWSVPQRINLEIAYGDIAVQIGKSDEARKIFLKTKTNEAYAGTVDRHKATLRLVRLEQMAKAYETALNILMELDGERIPELWSASRLARASIYYNMQDYNRAADDTDAILAREPDHIDAKLLQGEIQIKRRNLKEASELDVGDKSSQNSIVPGEKIKVTLNDPTLSVSGAGIESEVEIWTKEGDREYVMMARFGDEMTKFRGELPTALGAPVPGDRVLQVIGDDEIYYSYSERFLKKMPGLDPHLGGPITVRSDALLMVSSRQLLSEDEQRVADAVGLMAAVKRGDERSRAVAMERAASRGGNTSSAEQMANQLAGVSLKPGGTINIRVIDPDASRTAGIDEVAVSVRTSSGDAVGRVVLKETGTHTGWFEGLVRTAGAQASAIASSSALGLDPNMVISPRTALPAWRPSEGSRKQELRIDLNDNVELGSMKLTAAAPGAKLKAFILQTGMDVRDLKAVAAYPADSSTSVENSLNPSVLVVHDADDHVGVNNRSVYDFVEIRDHVSRGRFLQQNPAGVVKNVAGPSAAMEKSIPDKGKWQKFGVNRYKKILVAHVIYRFQGFFYEPRAVTRRFKLILGDFEFSKDTRERRDPPEFLLAVNGEVITDQNIDALEGEIDLKPGLHRFEIWGTGWVNCIGFGRSVSLLADLGEETTGPDGQPVRKMVACPDSFFNPATFPKSVTESVGGITKITASSDGTEFTVTFAPGASQRMINIIFKEHEGPVPAVNRIELSDSKGKRVLPVKHDYEDLRKNDQLEILTGDTVSVRYVDDRFVTPSKAQLVRQLNVAYVDGGVGFFGESRRKVSYKGGKLEGRLLRFPYGDPLFVAIADPDMDTTDKPDTVPVILESLSGGKKQFMATETGNSTGSFILSVVPVPGVPQSTNEFQVGKGETIVATYRDMENVRPGVPVDRKALIRHAFYVTPELRVQHATVSPIDYRTFNQANPAPMPRSLNIGFSSFTDMQRAASQAAVEVAQAGLLAAQAVRAPAKVVEPTGTGLVRPRWMIRNSWVDANSLPTGGVAVVHGRTLHLEIDAQHLALRPESAVEVYLQTDAGREQYRLLSETLGGAAGEVPGSEPVPPPFDIRVPGTIRRIADLPGSRAGSVHSWIRPPQIQTYLGGEGAELESDSDDYMRSRNAFSCSVPIIPGFLPQGGAADDAGKPIDTGVSLIAKPGENIHVGFRYQDESGTGKWLTVSAQVITHPVLDVMDANYRETMKTAYVGDKVYVRVVDLGADISDASDTIQVLMQAKSGAKHMFELLEAAPHSGVFNGAFNLAYASGQLAESNAVPWDVKRDGFPVVYGDVMGIMYRDRQGQKTDTELLRIHMGADGTVTPFAKRFDDSQMAAQTQFWLAEGHLEMAKRYRQLGESGLAVDEYVRAKDLLEKSMEMFRDADTRAQAEYLLGNLTQEEAEATEDKVLAESRFRAALSRYMRVTRNYPETVSASKAQFKIATVYEQLNEPDIAAEEYGKLAYKYPNSEFLALAMGRLGTHFWQKAAAYENRAKELLAKAEDPNAQLEGKAVEKLSVKEYLNSAKIFARLRTRFPDHELAGRSALRAGQAFMRAKAFKDALTTFKQVYEHEAYDGPEVRSQAMYWAGMCSETLGDDMGAYSAYKRLTYDFPESKWASYARGQLSKGSLTDIDKKLEAQKVEKKY
jgi:tetratricopeptide (TPR) repeat protein